MFDCVFGYLCTRMHTYMCTHTAHPYAHTHTHTYTHTHADLVSFRQSVREFPVAHVIDLHDVLGSASQRESLGTERVSMSHEKWVVELEVNPTHHIPVGSVAIRRSLKM